MKSSKYLAVAVVHIVGLSYCASGSLLPNSSSKNSSAVTIQHQQCPTWFFWNATSRECECTELEHDIMCSPAGNKTWLNWKTCMTYDNRTDSTVAGLCPYGDLQYEFKQEHDGQLQLLVPNNRLQLSEAMCGKVHREGLLCSRCKPGYGPSALSYNHACAKCLNSYSGWLLYFSNALIPTTIFFLVIVLCQVRTTSAPLNLFIFICQLVSAHAATIPYEFLHHTEGVKIIYVSGITLLTLWNLDFFRLLIPPFCVSENLSNLQMLTMDYIVAFYPLVLTVVMYICIQQHARGCKFLVCLWKPFSYCFAPLVRQFNWNPAASIVPTFASFLLLSSTKILTVSFSLLRNEHFYNMSNDGVLTTRVSVLYFDPNVTSFSQYHLPFAVIAIIVSSAFVIFPCLLLILYPTRLFQQFLNWCGIGCHAVHAFADAFSGCYKNGTNDTRDYRCFAGFYLFARIFMYANFITLQTHSLVPKLSSVALLVTFVLASPYKNKLYNTLDSIGLTLCAYRVCFTEYHSMQVLNIVIGFYTTFYFAVLVSCTVILKLNCRCSQKLKALADRLSGVRDTPHRERQEVTDHLPDRVVNPDGYRLLTEVNGQPQSFTINNSNTYGSIQ